MPDNRRNMLHSGVRFALFATSYSPLFLLIILKIYFKYSEYLYWGGCNSQAVMFYLKYFGLASLLLALMLFGSIGQMIFLNQISKNTTLNGTPVLIKDVKNKNSEAISYIGTYIIPFLFQDYSALYEIISILILLLVIYFIYINSTLILINPVLNLRYSLYEVDFCDSTHNGASDKTKTGLIITNERYLEDDDTMLFKKIGHKLYYGIIKSKGDD